MTVGDLERASFCEGDISGVEILSSQNLQVLLVTSFHQSTQPKQHVPPMHSTSRLLLSTWFSLDGKDV
jgi:hypothetical protein